MDYAEYAARAWVLFLLAYLPLSLFWSAWRLTRPALRTEATRNWPAWLLAYLVLPPVGWYRAYRLGAPALITRGMLGPGWGLIHVLFLYFLVADALIALLVLGGIRMLLVPILLSWLAVPWATVHAALFRRRESSSLVPAPQTPPPDHPPIA